MSEIGEGFRCLVDADLFRRANMARSIEETRYYINGVRIEPQSEGGVLLIATNGHILIAIRDPQGWASRAATIQLDRNMIKAAGRARSFRVPGQRSLAYKRLLAVDGRVAGLVDVNGKCPDDIDGIDATISGLRQFALSIAEMQLDGVIVDGVFPNWRSVVPKPVARFEAGQVSFDATYLATIGDALTEKNMRPALIIRSTDETGRAPFLITSEACGKSEIEGFGVMMPRGLSRLNAEGPPIYPGGLPYWFQLPSADEVPSGDRALPLEPAEPRGDMAAIVDAIKAGEA